MSIALLPPKTRDGHPSVAAALQIDAQDRVNIDPEGAIAWAKANGVPMDGGKLKVEVVNAYRTRAGLPEFRVLRARVVPSQVQPVQERRAAAGDAGAAPTAPAALPARSEPAAPEPAAGIPVAKEDQQLAPTSSAAPSDCLPPIAETEEAFLDLVLAHDGTVTGLATPTVAAWALAINTHNRPMNMKAVEGFVRTLREGRWMLTGEPAILTKEGSLSDGQHRLEAIRRSGIAAPMDFRFGIERAAFVATGIGTRRTAAAIVSLSGEKFASAKAGVARLLIHHDAQQMARYSGQVEPSKVLETLRDNPAIGEIAQVIQRHRFMPARTSPFGLALVLAARVHPMEKVLAFAAEVESGRSPDETSASYALHLRLRDASMRKERISQIDTAALTIIAFNAWVKGKTVSRLHLPDAARTSEHFPKVAAP